MNDQDSLRCYWWMTETAEPISSREEEERGSENNISTIILVR